MRRLNFPQRWALSLRRVCNFASAKRRVYREYPVFCADISIRNPNHTKSFFAQNFSSLQERAGIIRKRIATKYDSSEIALPIRPERHLGIVTCRNRYSGIVLAPTMYSARKTAPMFPR